MFDYYPWTARVFAFTPTNNGSEALKILRIAFIDVVDNFSVMSESVTARATYDNVTVDVEALSGNLRSFYVPRAFALILFIINWDLTFLVIYITIISLFSYNFELGEGTLILPVTVVLTIPSLRSLFFQAPPFGKFQYFWPDLASKFFS